MDGRRPVSVLDYPTEQELRDHVVFELGLPWWPFTRSDAYAQWAEHRGLLTAAATAWVEADHPRDPGGEGGGQFIEKDGVGVDDEELAGEALDALKGPRVFPTINGEVRPGVDQMERAESSWMAWPDRIAKAAERNGLPSSEAYIAAAEERAREQLFDAEVTIRTPVDVVDDVAEEWRFKSQFETQTSRGTLDNEIRANGESELFSYPDYTSSEDRPIYGYMQRMSGSGGWEGGVEQYGDVRWELKRDVRARTTFTQGDSLSLQRAPAPVDQPDFRALTPPYQFPDEAHARDRDILQHEAGIWGDVNYVEAQIHGGVRVDDVAAVVFPKHMQRTIEEGSSLPEVNPHRAEEERLRAAVAKLKHYGVTVEYR